MNSPLNTVFLVLEKYGHLSDVLRSEFFPHLAKEYRVVVLTRWIDEEEAKWQGYYVNQNTIYQPIHVRYAWLWDTVSRYIRLYFIREHDSLATIQILDYGRIPNRWHRILMIIGSFIPARLLTVRRYTRIEKCIARPSREFRELVEKYQPRLILTAATGTSALEAEVIIFAKHVGIPTVAVEFNHDFPYSKSKTTRLPDYIFAWNHVMKREIERVMHYPEERVLVTGCLRYDHYINDRKYNRIPSRDAFLESKGLDPSKKTILWATPTPGIYKMRGEFLRTLVRLKREKLLMGDPNIFVRLHPIDVIGPYREYMDIPGLHIERSGRVVRGDEETPEYKVEMDKNDMVNMTATFLYCDVVVCHASTIVVEAALFDKPIVGMGFPEIPRRIYELENNKVLLERGVERLADTPEQLCTLVNQYLENPALDRKERRSVASEWAPFSDGLSYKRAVNAIGKIIGNS
ncbi:MAG: hypothetical protein G01um101433_334 [Parcubacteria group bacterium Gr01-1014_33]|nr:MAG: hypothetical protein G01um101433_334 [Parcubacteria group bacterium Gr01-1014_33]